MGFEILKILYRLNYLGFHFVYYHCNVATVLELHFSRLLPSKGYFKVCFEVSVAIFARRSLLLGTSIPNNSSMTLHSIIAVYTGPEECLYNWSGQT